jgi:hypothetical protein
LASAYNFQVITDSHEHNFNDEYGWQETVTIWVPIANAMTVKRLLMGGVDTTGTVYIPMKSDLFEWAFVKHVNCKRIGLQTETTGEGVLSGTTDNHRMVEMQITYEVPPWQTVVDRDDDDGQTPTAINSGIILEEHYEPAGEQITVTTKDLCWDAAGTQKVESDEAPGLLYVTGVWNVTLHYVPVTQLDAVLDFIGQLNSTKNVSKTTGRIYDEETLLCSVPTWREMRSIYGALQYTVNLPMMWRPQGWNKFYRPTQAQPSSLFVVPNGVGPGTELKLHGKKDFAAYLPALSDVAGP